MQLTIRVPNIQFEITIIGNDEEVVVATALYALEYAALTLLTQKLEA